MARIQQPLADVLGTEHPPFLDIFQGKHGYSISMAIDWFVLHLHSWLTICVCMCIHIYIYTCSIIYIHSHVYVCVKLYIHMICIYSYIYIWSDNNHPISRDLPFFGRRGPWSWASDPLLPRQAHAASERWAVQHVVELVRGDAVKPLWSRYPSALWWAFRTFYHILYMYMYMHMQMHIL